MLSLLLMASTWQASPVPPPLAQSSAACDHPVYATDELVCGDPKLLALDRRLLAVLPKVADVVGSPWIEDQQAWFRRSRLCAFRADHATCAAQAYRDRIAVLLALSSSSAEPAGPCNPPEVSASTADQAGNVALVSRRKVIAVATPRGTAWQPFVSYRRSGRVITFRDFTGKVIARCGSKK